MDVFAIPVLAEMDSTVTELADRKKSIYDQDLLRMRRLHASDECLRRVGPNPKILLCDDQTSILLGTSGMRRLLAKSELLRDRTCCALDYICNFLGVRDVD
jgi:hypothetical protein